MKKFLSLVMALVMTMSLVTIGAGAAEYKDLTDKKEIQYEEAVAVLNKLGIISGYEDGSFRPAGALTRGAAAKIIVSLMIGTEAANNLTVSAAPYSDVPVTNTFAAVISYCKTAGYINGYTDGTFRPAAALTGYAFSKMLLGALGYDGKIEGFTGEGWVMNVAKLNYATGLTNDIVDFKGNDGVDRETACQLALNTLKATLVEYSGGLNITSDAGNISQAPERKYVTSNNKTINRNIYGGDAVNNGESGNTSAYYTLQFGEQHFQDLKLSNDGTADDDFYRLSNKWTYKNVTIGTYALTPDYLYTTSASGDTNADKVKDMGLKGFSAPAGYYENGKYVAFTASSDAARLEELAKLTDNGVQIEIFMDKATRSADVISRIVIVRTQLMQINAVKTSEVTLKKLSDDQKDNGTIVTMGTQSGFIAVNSVKDDDEPFKDLKDLKADDYVLVVPVLDGSSYKVASVSVPQTVTGKLTNILTKSGDGKVKAINLAGTEYKMSSTWTSEDDNLSQTTVLSGKLDSTAYLDTFGYAIYVRDVKDSNNAIIIDRIRSGLVDGSIVKYAEGWNAKGEEISINLGSSFDPTAAPCSVANEAALQGTVWEYQTDTSNDAEYKLVAHETVVNNPAGAPNGQGNAGLVFAPTQKQWIKNGQFFADVTGATTSAAMTHTAGRTIPMASDVKFIFLSTAGGVAGTDVTGITVRDGVTSIGEDKNNDNNYDAPSTDTIYNISYILNKDRNKVIAVVVANDDDAAVTANLIYIENINEHWIDAEDSNRMKSMFKAYDAQGALLDDGHSKYGKNVDGTTFFNAPPVGQGTHFFTYTKNEATGVYSLSAYTKNDKTTSVETAAGVNATQLNKDNGYFWGPGRNGISTWLNALNATFVDLDTGDGLQISSVRDMYQAIADGKADSFNLSYVFNGSENAGANTVSIVYVTATTSSVNDAKTPVVAVAAKVNGIVASTPVSANTGDEVILTATVSNAADCGTLAYQWKKDGAAIAGATGATYTVPTSGAAAAANYTCEVTNTDNNKTGIKVKTTTSSPISVTVSLAAYTYVVDVDISNNNAVTVEYDATTNSGSRPTDTMVKTDIRTALENAGWTVTKIAPNGMKIDFTATKGIEEGKFSFDTAAASTGYLTKFEVDGSLIANAVSDASNVDDLGVTPSNNAMIVKENGDVVFVANASLATTPVEVGAKYFTTDWAKVVVTGSPLTSDAGLTYTMTAANVTGAAGEVVTAANGDVYIQAGKDATATVTVSGTGSSGSKVAKMTVSTATTVATPVLFSGTCDFTLGNTGGATWTSTTTAITGSAVYTVAITNVTAGANVTFAFTTT